MKIVIIAGFAPSVLNFRKQLILELKKYAIITVFAPFEDETISREITALGVNYQPIVLNARGANFWQDLKSRQQLIKLFKAHSPDIVLSYTIKPVIWGSLAAKKANVKKIYSMITGLGYSFTNVTTFKRKVIRQIVCFLYQKAFRYNDLVFFQNHDDRELFRSLGILSQQKPSKILNGSGVDLDHYAFSVPAVSPARFLLIARLLKDKGILEYIEAAKIIKEKHADIEFHLVGYIDDNPAAISQHLLNQWITEEAIIFHGKLDDVRPVIRSCSVYVLPSYREGTPRSTLEAMSMGRAIITTNAPGCRETVIDGYNGFLIPIKNVDALVAVMTKMIENPELTKKMGFNSRQLAEKKYDVHAVNKVILKAMELV